MTRRLVSAAAASIALTFAGAASAGECPPGSPPSWFCEDTGVQPPSGAKPPPAGDATGDERTDAEAERERGDLRPMPEPPPPPPPGPPVRQVSPPKAGAKRWREKFGLNLRLEGVPIPDGLAHRWRSYEDPGMGGLGASFRWRPIPHFALDIGLDALGGIDYSGNDRFESVLSTSGIFYLNPQHKVQAYLIGGIHVAHAEVDNDDYRPNLAEYGYSDDYDYFGGQAGVGVEFRVSRRVGIDLDGLVLARTRTDGGEFPEFLDPRTGETGNSSVGGMLRAGVTIWF
jgi:hypothetical protein